MESALDVLKELYGNYIKCPYDHPYDLKNHDKRFCYFEAIIDKDRNVLEAINGHTRGLVMMIARDKNMTPEEVDLSVADTPFDYLERLIELSGAVLVWYDFIKGPCNDKQKNVINYLVKEGFLSSAITI